MANERRVCTTECIQALQEHVEKLGREYLKNHPHITEEEEALYITSIAEREINIKFPPLFGEPDEILKTGKKNRAAVLLNAGKIMICSEYENTLAYKFLAKSARLDPTVAETWYRLGLCVFKRNDMKYAIGCFQKALKLDRTPEALTALAGVYRTQANLYSNKAQQPHLRKVAIDLLEEAVRMNPELGMAQMALGTGYFFKFFSTMQTDQELLTKARNCYAKAINCKDTYAHIDIHFNYSTLLKFCDYVEDALLQFDLAAVLDPRDANKAIEKRRQYVSYLKAFSGKISSKCGLHPNAIKSIMDSMKDDVVPPNAVFGQVVQVCSPKEMVPLTVVFCTKEGVFTGATIYNTSNSFKFEPGDFILIKKPVRRSIPDIETNSKPPEKIGAFQWYRVESPRTLQKNRKDVSFDCISQARLEGKAQPVKQFVKKFQV